MAEKTTGFKVFLARKGVMLSARRYFALGSMAMGLFASLLIGTIFDTLATHLGWEWPDTIATYCSSIAGPAIAVSIGSTLGANGLVLLSVRGGRGFLCAGRPAGHLCGHHCGGRAG